MGPVIGTCCTISVVVDIFIVVVVVFMFKRRERVMRCGTMGVKNPLICCPLGKMRCVREESAEVPIEIPHKTQQRNKN